MHSPFGNTFVIHSMLCGTLKYTFSKYMYFHNLLLNYPINVILFSLLFYTHSFKSITSTTYTQWLRGHTTTPISSSISLQGIWELANHVYYINSQKRNVSIMLLSIDIENRRSWTKRNEQGHVHLNNCAARVTSLLPMGSSI